MLIKPFAMPKALFVAL